MNSTATKVLFLLVVLALAVWWGNDKYQLSKIATSDQKHRIEQQKQVNEKVRAISERYGAITDWNQKLENLSSPYSVQIEDAIIPEGGKPITVEGMVEDVARHDNQFYIYLTCWNAGGVNLHFVIECDTSTEKAVIAKCKLFTPLTVVAQVTSVEKAQIALRSGQQTSEDLAPVEIESPSLFVAHGKCLEAIFSDN